MDALPASGVLGTTRRNELEGSDVAAAEALLTVTVVCEPFSKSATTASVAGCVCAKRRDDVPASSNKADKTGSRGSRQAMITADAGSSDKLGKR
jgi:hypothetical protein